MEFTLVVVCPNATTSGTNRKFPKPAFQDADLIHLAPLVVWLKNYITNRISSTSSKCDLYISWKEKLAFTDSLATEPVEPQSNELIICRSQIYHIMEILCFSTFRSNVATLHVYYKEKTSFLYKTQVYYGIENFIGKDALVIWECNWYNGDNLSWWFIFTAAVGGILSLGLGLSFIGIIELAYYLFFRCYVPLLSASREQSSEDSSEDPLPLSYRLDNDNRSFVSSKTTPNSSTSNLAEARLGHLATNQGNIKMVEIALD